MPRLPRLPVFTVVDETQLLIHSNWFFEECPREWEALLDWCRVHGLDPARMPAAGQVILRDLVRCHAQGETPPMPFPDVILAHLNQPRETA